MIRRFAHLRKVLGQAGFATVLVALVSSAIGLNPLSSGLAQTSDGKIVGTVYDSSRAAIPGATVVAKAERTGVDRTATTNEHGYYIVPGLQPSSYTVTVTASGFQSTSAKNVGLSVGQVHTIDFVVNPSGTT